MSLNIFSLSLVIMHNSEISNNVKGNKTKNKRSDKDLGSWTESDNQFDHLLGRTIYHIPLYSKLYGKFAFIISNTFLHDLKKSSSP